MSSFRKKYPVSVTTVRTNKGVVWGIDIRRKTPGRKTANIVLFIDELPGLLRELERIASEHVK